MSIILLTLIKNMYFEYYTREAIKARLAEIQASTPKNPGSGETAPSGKSPAEINIKLYAEMEFLQEVLEQSIIAFPVKVPTLKIR